MIDAVVGISNATFVVVVTPYQGDLKVMIPPRHHIVTEVIVGFDNEGIVAEVEGTLGNVGDACPVVRDGDFQIIGVMIL